MCSLKDCSVCECTEDEIPVGWKAPKAPVEPEGEECSESTEREARLAAQPLAAPPRSL